MANTQMLRNLLYSNSAEIYLRAGQMNQYVTALQQLLHELGYDRELMWSVYGADGYYGQTLVNAVGKFGAQNGIPTGGMSVSASLLSKMLNKHSGQQSSTGGSPGFPSQPQPESKPKPPSSDLQVRDQGDRVNVSNGQQQVSFIKRDAGLAYYGSITIDDAIQKNASLIKSLGITPSALNVMKSVSENEGKLDAINTYDRAFLSIGIFQWTIGAHDGTGELPAVLKKLKDNFPGDFRHYFSSNGLDVSPDTTSTYGYLTLNGSKIDTMNEKEQFRKPEWAFRFWLACQDAQMQAIEIDHALSRLKTFYWSPKYTINGFTISEIITSEYGVALILDQHVNRPSYVQPSIEKAMQQTGLTNPTFWGTQEEMQVIETYLNVRATYSTGSASPMTKAHERAAVTQKYLHRGVISAERNSFHYSQQMIA